MSSPRTSDPNSGDLLSGVRGYIAERKMLAPGDRIVVGVSGGPDSVALLDLLSRLREEWRLALCVAHLNHQLRGAASDGDAAFVAGLASGLGLPYHGDACDVGELARREKRSLEESARMARRRFLEGVRRATGSDRIALGHTRSDQAETVLFRLLRGAGRTGLGGIRPVRERTWVRPLLGVSRREIEAYIAFRNLASRQDESNADLRFVRNRIRWDLLPHLESDYTPGIEAVLARTAEILQQEDDLLEQQADAALQEALRYRGKRKIILDTCAVFGYHISIQRRVFRKALFWLRAGANALRFQNIQDILKLLPHRSGTAQISPEILACRSDCRLILSRATPPFQVPLQVPGRVRIPLLDVAVEARVRPAEDIEGQLRNLGPYRACFDLKKLEGAPVLRSRRSGDRFQPYGMSGTRKVGEFLIDSKVPRPLRDEVPLLMDGDTALWVVGLRRAQHAAVTAQTREVLEIEITGGWTCLLDSQPQQR